MTPEQYNLLHPSKTWTKVPRTTVAGGSLRYIMGSYTATAVYSNLWDHRGRLVPMVLGYNVAGPNLPTVFVTNLGVARNFVRRVMRSTV